MQTHLEAKVLTEFYESRYLRLSHNAEDLQEAKRQNDRALGLIPRISDLQREVFEALGDVRIAYRVDEKIGSLIDGIYKFKGAEIKGPDHSAIKTEGDLNKWKEETNRQINDYLNREFNEKFHNLLPLLLAQLKDKV